MTEDSIPEDDLISSITPDVMRCLKAKEFSQWLDNHLSPVDSESAQVVCRGDFAKSERILKDLGLDETELGEILYNVADTSRLKAKYWRAKAKRGAPQHHGGNVE